MSTNSPNLLRPELVEASMLRAITTGMGNYGLIKQPDGFVGAAPNVVVREAFPIPDERESELQATTLALGFSTDDGGRPAELGSSLTKYVRTLTAWVFALDPAFGRRVAYSIENICRVGQGQWGIPDSVPLLDFNSDPTAPQSIDLLLVLGVQVEHLGNNSTRPWDRYVWTTKIDLQDTFYPEEDSP